MKRFIAAASAFALFVPGSTGAQQALPSPVEATKIAAADVELEGPALWSISDDDTTVYLFGTVHVLPADVDWFHDDIAEALNSSSTLVTELVADANMATEMQQLVATQGVLPADQTLRGLLDEEQTRSYEAALTGLGLPVAAFDRFEPWYAAMMLSMLPLMQQGYQLDKGVEMVLTKEAGEDASRESLETLAYQIEIFDRLPIEDQLTFMMEVADNIDEVKPTLDLMVAEWLEGDADALATLMNDGLSNRTLAESLLYTRNRNWAEWIDTRLDTPGTVFVAVGAGHLAGANSVQDVLKQRGIEAVRVR